MDETLRVKIVAETSQATSSLKQLNKESSGLGTNTNAATQAVNHLDKALNSVGFKSIRIKGLADAFKGAKESSKAFASSLSKAVSKTSELGNSLHRFKKLNPFHVSETYLEKMSKISSQSVNKIKELQRAITVVGTAGSKGDFSGLAGLRKQVEELARSRNKVITKTFSEADFSEMKNHLLTASKAAANGASSEFEKAMFNMSTTVGKATEKLTFKTLFVHMRNNVMNLGKTILSLIGKIAKAVAATGIVALIIGGIAAIKNAFNVSELGDQIDKTSQKVGMATDAYQKWAYVLERCGIEASQLKTAMRGLTRSANGANADYFKQLGIDPSKLSQQQLFEQTVKALQNVSDSAERARLAYKLFGQSSAELAPLLNINAQEVQRLSYQYDLLGATMSGKVIRASADMQDALTDLRAAFQGLKNTLGQVLIPIITKAIIRLTVFIAKVNMVLQALFGIETEFADVETSTENITTNVSHTNNEVKKLKTLISGFDELNIFPSQNNGADLGSFLDDLGDYGSDITPTIGNILPPEAIAELEYFRDNLLPGIVEKIQGLIDKWEEFKVKFKETIEDIEYALSGQKWQDAFDNGTVGDLTFWDMLLDLIGQVARGLEELQNGSLKGLFEEWFPIGGELPEEGWFKEWEHRFFYGTEEEYGLFEMPGIKEIKEFFDWINETFYNGEGPLGKMPESWEEMFTLEGMFGENLANLFRGEGWDWTQSGLYQFGEWISNWTVWEDIGNWDIWKASWWSEKWEAFKHNVSPSYWWNGDEDTIGLKEMLGFDKIEQWDIWKGEWWSGLWGKLTSGFNGGATASQGKFLTASINPLKLFNLDGIADWNIWKPSWWQEKWNGVKTGWNNSALVQFFKNAWGSITTWFNQSVKPKFTVSYWQQKFRTMVEGFQNTPLIKALTAGWLAIKLWWATNVAPKFTKKYWQEKWNSIKEGLSYSSLLLGVQEKWTAVKTWYNQNIAPKFTWAYWKEKWNTIANTLASIDLGNAAKKMMNRFLQAVEDGINKTLDAISQSGIGKFIGINLGHIWIPKFQTYAQGGVITEPTAGIMGEYPGANSNPEIVTPENKMREVFESSNNDIVDVLIQGFKQIVQAIDEKDTTVQIGDTTIAKSAARGNRQYRLQTGQSLF